jgi:hypothetical protein
MNQSETESSDWQGWLCLAGNQSDGREQRCGPRRRVPTTSAWMTNWGFSLQMARNYPLPDYANAVDYGNG